VISRDINLDRHTDRQLLQQLLLHWLTVISRDINLDRHTDNNYYNYNNYNYTDWQWQAGWISC